MPHDPERVTEVRAWHDIPFRRTHDLSEIGRQCIGVEASLADLCRRAERLTAFAWMYRYPGEPEEPAREEAEGALARPSGEAGIGLRPLPIRFCPL